MKMKNYLIYKTNGNELTLIGACTASNPLGALAECLKANGLNCSGIFGAEYAVLYPDSNQFWYL
jgi:hypothetical protein